MSDRSDFGWEREGSEFAWTFPEPPRIAHTKMMVFDPRTPQRIYAAIEQGALLKTEDGGQSWRELAEFQNKKWPSDI